MDNNRNKLRLLDQRWHDAAYWGLMLAACAVFLAMNVLTPFKEDDMLHSLVIGELTHVESFGDLLRSWWNKLFVLNGRSSDMIAELFCAMLGKPVFNVLNAVVFGLFSHAVSLLSTGRHSLLALSLLYCCVAVCYPYPGETLLWLAGSVNYLWTITASLWLLLYLERHDGSRPLGWAKGLLLFLASFVAGSGNEATSFGFLGAWCVYYLLNRDRFDRRVLVVLAGYALGVLLIMASPAAWLRASGSVVRGLPITQMLVTRLGLVAERMLHHITPLTALIIGIIWLIRKGFKPLKSNIWAYLLVFLTLVMLVLGIRQDRPYAPLATVSLIVTVMAIDALLRRWRYVSLAVIVAALGLTATLVPHELSILSRYKAYEGEIIAQVKAAPANAVLHKHWFDSDSRFLMPLMFASDCLFSNEYVWRSYYDKENVQFVSDSVYARYHEGRLFDGAVDMPFESSIPSLVAGVQGFPDQDYMVMNLNVDTIPATVQVGQVMWDGSCGDDNGKNSSYMCYYPLKYRNQVLFVLPLASDCDTTMLLLLDYKGTEELWLKRTAPNPPEVKKKPE